MARAWQVSAPPERLGEARPGALLTAAAAVPLGAALVLAAGMLPGGARMALGLAVVALGVGVRALEGTPTGARVRPAVVRALGAGLIVGGVVVALAAVGVALDGGRVEATDASEAALERPGLASAGAGPYGVFATFSAALDGWPAAAFGALLAGAGAALLRDDRLRRAAGVLAGVGSGLAIVGLTGEGAVGLGPDARSLVALAVAAAATGAAWRRSAGAVAGGAVGVAAGVLVALVVGEATGIVRLSLSSAAGAPFAAPTRQGAVAAVLLLAAAVAAALVVLAVRRRDVVLGALPAGVLLLAHPVEAGVGQAGVLVVPVLLVAVAGAAAAGFGPALRVLPRAVAPAALVVAVLVLLVQLDGAIADPSGPLLRTDGTGFSASGVRGGRLAVALVCTLGIAAIAGVALRVRGATGPVAAVAALVGLHLLHPLGLFRTAAPDSFVAGDVGAVVFGLAEIALGLVVARRHPTLPVLAAFGLLLVSGLQAIAVGVASSGDDVDGRLLVGSTCGPAALAVVVPAARALAGPARQVAGAQAVAAGALLGALLLADVSGTALAFAGDAGAVLEGGDAVLGLALVALLALGLALLAASTARRPSTVIATAVIAGTASLAMAVASVGAAVAGGRMDDVQTLVLPAIQTGFGFEGARSALARAPVGWPLLLGVLGAVLLATGAWLESRRPAPPDAPLG